MYSQAMYSQATYPQATQTGLIQLRFSANPACYAGTAGAAASLIVDAAAGFRAPAASLYTDSKSLESTLSS